MTLVYGNTKDFLNFCCDIYEQLTMEKSEAESPLCNKFTFGKDLLGIIMLSML